jgi:hypothetical protein
VIVPVLGGSLKCQRAALLDYYTQAVEAARLPTEQQIARFGAIPIPSTLEQPLVRYLLIAVNRFAESYLNALAEERSGIVALALERYRRKTGQWPKQLAEMVPSYLAKIPVDPFTGKPLLYRSLADGVVVYSVGVDGVDDGGKLDRKSLFQRGTGIDIGVQLWNVNKRRQAYREK